MDCECQNSFFVTKHIRRYGAKQNRYSGPQGAFKKARFVFTGLYLLMINALESHSQPDPFERNGRSAAELRSQLVDILAKKAIKRFEEPIELASGALSDAFVDGKEGLSHVSDLAIASMAMVDTVWEHGISFDAVGGMAVGANHLAISGAGAANSRWFIVRKEDDLEVGERRIEGTKIDENTSVLVVEDVVSTAGSMLKAMQYIDNSGAHIAAATTLIDRGDIASQIFEELGIPYFPMATYDELGLEPVATV